MFFYILYILHKKKHRLSNVKSVEIPKGLIYTKTCHRHDKNMFF